MRTDDAKSDCTPPRFPPLGPVVRRVQTTSAILISDGSGDAREGEGGITFDLRVGHVGKDVRSTFGAQDGGHTPRGPGFGSFSAGGSTAAAATANVDSAVTGAAGVAAEAGRGNSRAGWRPVTAAELAQAFASSSAASEAWGEAAREMEGGGGPGGGAMARRRREEREGDRRRGMGSTLWLSLVLTHRQARYYDAGLLLLLDSRNRIQRFFVFVFCFLSSVLLITLTAINLNGRDWCVDSSRDVISFLIVSLARTRSFFS